MLSMRATVLLLQRQLLPLAYRLPEGTRPGTLVEAPLGSRRVTGVVWDEGIYPGIEVAADKLRDAVPLALPPLPEPLRRLVDFVADYYLAAPSSVLRMALPQAAFLAPPAPPRRFRPGDMPPARPGHPGRNPRRQALLDRLAAARHLEPATIAEWAARTGASPARLRALAGAGALLAVAETAESAPPRPAPPPGPKLSDGQQRAADALSAAVRARQAQTFLLDGVTGAGKTEVYLEAVAAAIGDGGQALVLLPEIGLTQGFLQRFHGRFGFMPTVWHSALTPAARRDSFHRIVSGRAEVIVGARSALFLGAPDLRLIVVDEAHDPALKQEEGVPYHGRDVAVMRGRFQSCPVVLATATPPLETLEQVARGRYRVLHLPDRHGKAELPRIHMIDLRKTPPPRRRWIAPPLAEAIGERLRRQEQTLLFLNRRGYAPLTLCRGCGERIQCPNCTAWLVEHRASARLVCHHCGHSIPVPPACPACGTAGSLAPCGPGVERLAEEVAERWPEAKTRLATSDSIRTPADMADLVAAVEEKRVDILIGTQMLAKGHDFPNLTLVGVIDADLGLAGGDLRAAERVFQQIRQVSGRAGRADKPGDVYLQSFEPGARVMRALVSGDADAFHAAERESRLAARMPPFGRLAAVILSAVDGARAEAAAAALGRAAPAADGIEVWGPAPAPLARLRGRYRYRLLVHAKRTAPLQQWLRAWLAAVPLPASVRVQVDVDPQSFL